MKEIPKNVYPDHALIVALHVFTKFKSASEALAMVKIELGNSSCEYPEMICNPSIPGSGCAVRACCRMIELIKEKRLTPETACLWADGQ